MAESRNGAFTDGAHGGDLIGAATHSATSMQKLMWQHRLTLLHRYLRRLTPTVVLAWGPVRKLCQLKTRMRLP